MPSWSDRRASRRRDLRRRAEASEADRLDTTPVQLPRAQTAPLPVAGSQPPGDDHPTVVDAVPLGGRRPDAPPHLPGAGVPPQHPTQQVGQPAQRVPPGYPGPSAPPPPAAYAGPTPYADPTPYAHSTPYADPTPYAAAPYPGQPPLPYPGPPRYPGQGPYPGPVGYGMVPYPAQPPTAAPDQLPAPGGVGGVPAGTAPAEPTEPAEPAAPAPRVTVTRVAAARSRELALKAVRRVDAASRADGAGESGLTALLWVNALHAAGDAMIAVSLAGTLFFAAAGDAQRSNVALYLLVTVAPFAVIAPVIGPLLDRLHRGRRYAMAGTLIGRTVLAGTMIVFFDDLGLYPAALGVLVLSKAFNVLKAAVVPRVLPAAMSLTSANARMSVFGLASSGVLGGVGAGLAATLGFGWELGATAAVFLGAGVLALRLPAHVDVPAGELPATVLSADDLTAGPTTRPSAGAHVVTALRATAALRGLSGFLTIFAAFLTQATFADGWEATSALGVIAVAAGVGSFLGTGIGSRLHAARPDTLVLVSAGAAAAITVVAAALYSFPVAALVVAVSSVSNALGKVALDAIIQREVPDQLRASAFGRSETWLQLAWVLGGAVAIALPPNGRLGFAVAAALLALAVGLVLWGQRPGRPAPQPGSRRFGRRTLPATAQPDDPTRPRAGDQYW